MKNNRKKQSKRGNLILLFLFLFLLFSCGNRSKVSTRIENCSKQQLLDGLVREHDVRCYDQLLMSDDYSWDELVLASLFAGDSLHYLRGYEMFTYDMGERNTELFYSAILLTHRQSAFYYSFKEIIPVKDCVEQWIVNSDKWFDEEQVLNTDSLLDLILAVEDDSSYVRLRAGMPYEVFSPVVKSLADDKGLASAACDVFLSRISSRYNYLAEESVADTALLYLEKSADAHFPPAVFYKSLLLLTGTYLPQDTITRRELFLSCIDSTDYIPFWRGKMTY